jgi:hypothetical protein
MFFANYVRGWRCTVHPLSIENYETIQMLSVFPPVRKPEHHRSLLIPIPTQYAYYSHISSTYWYTCVVLMQTYVVLPTYLPGIHTNTSTTQKTRTCSK